MKWEEIKKKLQEEPTYRRHNDPEHHLQCRCVNYFRVKHKGLSLLLFAVPNGGQRSKTTAAKLKAEGVVPGVADLLLLCPHGQYHGLCIEMKTEKGRQSDKQKIWQQAVEKQGYKYVVCRSVDDFKERTEEYLNL